MLACTPADEPSGKQARQKRALSAGLPVEREVFEMASAHVRPEGVETRLAVWFPGGLESGT